MHTLRNQEQGRREPEGPALALPRIAARHPLMCDAFPGRIPGPGGELQHKTDPTGEAVGGGFGRKTGRVRQSRSRRAADTRGVALSAAAWNPDQGFAPEEFGSHPNSDDRSP